MSGERGKSGNQEGEGHRRQQELEFITFTSPESARDAANQQLVRRHAMRDYHRRTDRPRLRKNEIELDVTPLLERSAAMALASAGSSAVWGQAQAGLSGTSAAGEETGEEIQRSANLVTVPGASRVDPFFQYPVEMGHRERELCDHSKWRFSYLVILHSEDRSNNAVVYDESCIHFRTMRDFGFLNRIRNSTAFCQFLSTSSWHMAHLRGSDLRNDYLHYSMVATRELQKQINDPNQCTTIDAVLAVLGFAVCAVSWIYLNNVSVSNDPVESVERYDCCQSTYGRAETHTSRKRRLSVVRL